MKATCPHCGGELEAKVDVWIKGSGPIPTDLRIVGALPCQRIKAYLHREGCMSERVMYRRMHLSFSECAKAVDELRAGGAVTISGAQPRMIHLVGQCSCDV